MTRRSARIGAEWATPEGSDFTWQHVVVEVLMDIRDELRSLNGLLHCPNFTSIPHKLDKIRVNTAKPKPKKASA